MLEIKNLNYNIEEKNEIVEILKDINLSFENGKTYCITGPNGSGKSTLVKMIMGILASSEGEIFFDKKNITSLPINERAKLGISFAFQQPVTFKGLKVRDLLSTASGKNDFNSMCDVLAKVGLCAKDYINRNLDDKLSGGELKRIELAMLLSRQSKINIFDEPEAGIDLWSFENLTKIFSSLEQSTNIIVSHQQKILNIADYIILLKNGQIAAFGSKEDVLPILQQNNKCSKLRGENE